MVETARWAKCPRQQSSAAKGFNRAQIFGQFNHSVMNRDTTAAEFLQESRLRQARDFRRLTESCLFGDEQADGEMQRRVARREPRFDGFWQDDFHGERVEPKAMFCKR